MIDKNFFKVHVKKIAFAVVSCGNGSSHEQYLGAMLLTSSTSPLDIPLVSSNPDILKLHAAEPAKSKRTGKPDVIGTTNVESKNITAFS